jgi:hypothetical protein
MPTRQQKAIQLKVVDFPQLDKLAKLRLEHKYEYRHSDGGKLESILKVNNQAVFHTGRVSIVNSIYFDSPSLTSFQENLAGIGRRFKLRLRWYDSELPQRCAFFEVKRRINRATTKDRYQIETSRPLHEMGLQEMVGQLHKILPEGPRTLLGLRSNPIVLVRYQRHHFRVRDVRLQIRLTLDQHIEGFNQMGFQGINIKNSVYLHDRSVLEVKTACGQKQEIPSLLFPLRPRLSRFSKYVACCCQMGSACGIQTPAFL